MKERKFVHRGKNQKTHYSIRSLVTDPSGSKKKAAAAAAAAGAATAAARTKSLMGKKPYKTHNAVMQSLLRTKVITLHLEWNRPDSC